MIALDFLLEIILFIFTALGKLLRRAFFRTSCNTLHVGLFAPQVLVIGIKLLLIGHDGGDRLLHGASERLGTLNVHSHPVDAGIHGHLVDVVVGSGLRQGYHVALGLVALELVHHCSTAPLETGG